MATSRDLLNKVLTGLRKDRLSVSATDVSSAYERLLLQQVNVAKSEVESAWDWYVLRETVTATTEVGREQYDLTLAADADVDVSHNARLLYERLDTPGQPESSIKYAASLPQVYDVTDGPGVRLREVAWEQAERFAFQDDDPTGQPIYFALRSAGEHTQLFLYPAPEKVRTIKLRFVLPQEDLPEENLAQELSVPAKPVWLRALFYANQERGEELGRPNSSLDRQAHDALANSVSVELTDADITSLPE